MKILISDAFDASLPEKLRPYGEVLTDKARLPEADVVLVRSKTKCTREYIDGAPRLKLIIRGGVGLDNIDLEYAAEKGILVKNTPEASSIAVAELAMALMLAAVSRIVEGHETMTRRTWAKKQLKRMELWGKTLGIVGIGRIGREVAARASAFGMRVIAFDKYVERSDAAEMVSWDTLLESSDIISLHTPKTPETEGLIDAKALAAMKDDAILVNTSRGSVIVERDVADALTGGKLRAYCTDVWLSDPPDWDACPLFHAPNVIMTPHIGASSRENLLRIGDIVESIIKEFVKENEQ